MRINVFHKCVVAVFCVYLVLGNIPRVGHFFRFGGFPVTELILYLFLLCGCIWYRIKVPRLLLLVSTLFLVSWSMGALMNSELAVRDHMYALMYAVRICGIIVGANYIGWIFSRALGFQSVQRYYIGIAIIQVVIGVGIYLAFPKAEYLWLFLSQYGIIIVGDPHVRRLVGPIFDPNFFGNLLILPSAFIASSILLGRSRIASPVFLLLLAAIMMTCSRSSLLGLVVCLFVLLVLLLLSRPDVRYLTLGRVVCLCGVLTVVLLALMLWHPGMQFRTLERVAGVSIDESALNRLYHFHKAVNRAFSFPGVLTGVGYNYIPFAVRIERIATGFDQSLLTLCVTLGVPIATLAVVLLCRWLREALVAVRRLDVGLYAALLAYLLASLVMSFFNNLLLLPLYLFTVLPLLSYGYWKGRAEYDGS